MTTGRSASLRSLIARSSAAPSASGPVLAWGAVRPSSGTSAWEKTRSSGKSTKVGPEWGAWAARNASSTRPGISAVVSGVAASFVRGATNGTWSISWSEPWPQRIAGARPARTTSGELFICAEPSALMPFVTPGPAVRAATPGSRVAFAQPSAANAAVCSWRVSTMSIPSSRQPS